MIFRLTKILARKLNMDNLPRTDILDQRSVWHATLFRVSGVQYIVLTESLTLFSFLFHGKGIVDGQTFAKTARDSIGTKFKENGWTRISRFNNII